MKRRYSPCVGFCSTTFGDAVCRGCNRTQVEVDTWNAMTLEEREIVWKRLENEVRDNV